MNVILIDSGTTNSRIRLVNEEENKVIDVVKIQVGVRNTAIDGNNDRLKAAIQTGIKDIISKNNLTAEAIRYIVASGMITSNLGIYEVPHVSSPAGVEDFVTHSKIIRSSDFLDIPCILIPGMKNKVENSQKDPTTIIEQYDVMRGEEVETFGLLKQVDVSGKGVMVLPGSHTKFVEVQEDKSINACLSTLGGELLHAVQKETILSNSLHLHLIESLDQRMLQEGYNATKKLGLTRGLYQVRLLQLFSDCDANDRANFLVGAVLYNDIQALLHSTNNLQGFNWIIVGGSYPLRKAFVQLLGYTNSEWNIIEATDEQVDYSLVYGAQEIASRYLLLNS
jgi:2-dehydro-3-deoxygalactonokinase